MADCKFRGHFLVVLLYRPSCSFGSEFPSPDDGAIDLGPNCEMENESSGAALLTSDAPRLAVLPLLSPQREYVALPEGPVFGEHRARTGLPVFPANAVHSHGISHSVGLVQIEVKFSMGLSYMWTLLMRSDYDETARWKTEDKGLPLTVPLKGLRDG